jgi:SEC-C motif-containing protein
MSSKPCPCGSQKSYDECCGPFISGKAYPETPEALMRSRYTAFTQANMPYLSSTMTIEMDEEETRAFAESAEWIGLDVHEARDNIVEFSAHFVHEGQKQRVHERSVFIQKDGRWLYNGHEHRCSGHETHQPIRVEKIGRNEPCHCGSGKKYKKCCG